MPPSAKLAAYSLYHNGEMRQKELADDTRLPNRTVRHALGKLEEEGLVESSYDFSDARSKIYGLKE